MKNILLLLLSFTISACDSSKPAVFSPLSTDAVILAFGDSLTYGAGAEKTDSYPSVLSRLSQRTVINAGISGEVTHDGLQRLPAVLDQYQPELMILIHGGNDMLRNLPKQNTLDNLTQMVQIAQQRNIKVVMLGVPSPRLFLLSSAPFYQQVADTQSTPIDLETLPQILSDRNLKSDRVHPNAAGYQLMANNILKLLVETGAL
ncbi:MAG: arylesterase [Methyloprofundus sp.]|nr:arylesterase [Methyloprofundus sp.]